MNRSWSQQPRRVACRTTWILAENFSETTQEGFRKFTPMCFIRSSALGIH